MGDEYNESGEERKSGLKMTEMIITRDWSLLSLTGGSLYSTRDRNVELAEVRCGESRST